MPDRHLLDGLAGESPAHDLVQQLIDAERGHGEQGVVRAWQASDSNKVVLTSDSTGVKISRDNGATAPRQVVVDGTAAGGSLSGTYPAPSLAPSTLDALIPPGMLWPYLGVAVPAGWLACDGAGVPTASYPKLFAAIAYRYGGSGATFNLPDFRGRVLLGVSAAHPLGTVGGAESVPAPQPAHTHPGTHSHGLNGHTHATGAGHAHDLPSHVHGGPLHQHAGPTHHHAGPLHNHSGAPMTISGTAASSGNTNGLYIAGGATATTVAHTHVVSGAVAGNTADAGSADTADAGGGNTADAGGGTTGAPTGYPSGPSTGTAAPTTDGPSPGTTATDATAPGAAYGAPGTVATLPPFGTATMLIKVDA